MIAIKDGRPELKRTTTNDLSEAAGNKLDLRGNINYPSDISKSRQTDKSIIDAEDFKNFRGFKPEFQGNTLFTRAILNRPDNEDSLRGIA